MLTASGKAATADGTGADGSGGAAVTGGTSMAAVCTAGVRVLKLNPQPSQNTPPLRTCWHTGQSSVPASGPAAEASGPQEPAPAELAPAAAEPAGDADAAGDPDEAGDPDTAGDPDAAGACAPPICRPQTSQ